MDVWTFAKLSDSCLQSSADFGKSVASLARFTFYLFFPPSSPLFSLVSSPPF